MKIFLLIFVLISSAFAVVYFNISFHQENEKILTQVSTQDPRAATNHNWSNR